MIRSPALMELAQPAEEPYARLGPIKIRRASRFYIENSNLEQTSGAEEQSPTIEKVNRFRRVIGDLPQPS